MFRGANEGFFGKASIANLVLKSENIYYYFTLSTYVEGKFGW